jgi:CheY-like chemotaxis protein
VNDDPVFLKMMAELLIDLGYRVAITRCGCEQRIRETPSFPSIFTIW